MNRGTIRTKARRKLDETAAKFWTDDDLNDYIDQGYNFYWQWMVQAQHNLTITTTTLNLVSGTATIALPSDFLEARLVERVTANYTIPLPYYERYNTLNMTSGYVDNASAVYTCRFLGSSLLLEPTPQITETGGIKLTYFRTPTALSSDSDTPEIPSIFHDMLVTYTVIQAKEKEEAESNQPADVAPFIRTLEKQEQLFKESIERSTTQRVFVQPFSLF